MLFGFLCQVENTSMNIVVVEKISCIIDIFWPVFRLKCICEHYMCLVRLCNLKN